MTMKISKIPGIVINNQIIRIASNDNKEHLHSLIPTSMNRIDIYDTLQSNTFYFVTLENMINGIYSLVVTFGAEDNVFSPLIEYHNKSSLLIIGNGQRIILINATYAKILCDIEFSAPIYYFYTIPNEEIIIIVYEIGVICCGFNGNVQWSYNMDIIMRTNITENYLEVDTAKAKYLFNLKELNGHPIIKQDLG